MADVETQVHGETLIIRLNRPHVRNAVNATVARAIADSLALLDNDPTLRVGVLTGTGAGFCSGMDLSEFARGETPRIEGRGFAGMTERSAEKPLVAAVEGFAVAGGFEILLACDLIVASRGARLGLPEVGRGLTPAAGGSLRLPTRIPFHVAMELLLTGELITSERAYELGLVNRLTEPGGALAEALSLAERLARNAPLSLRAVKRTVTESPGWPLAERFERQEEITAAVASSQDAREGARAFLEKRPAIWRGE